jgi:hypothetical protein
MRWSSLIFQLSHYFSRFLKFSSNQSSDGTIFDVPGQEKIMGHKGCMGSAVMMMRAESSAI